MGGFIALFCCFVTAVTASQAVSKRSHAAGVVASGSKLPIDGINAEIRIPDIFSPPDQPIEKLSGGRIVLGLDTINCSCPATVGIQFLTQHNRSQYHLFYQWLGGKPVWIEDVTVEAGDDVRIGIQGDEYLMNDSAYNGTIYFTNYSNGQNTTISTAHKIPDCAKNAIVSIEQLGNFKLARFSTIQLSDVYYVGNYGTFLHGIPISEGSESFNLTRANGNTLVTATVDAVSMNFTYVA